MKQVAALFLGILIVTTFSCKKDDPTVPDFGYNYFPDEPGRYVVYTVDSFYYDDFNNEVDTVKFQLKEKIHSIYVDNEGRETMRLERYVRYFNDSVPYSALPWTLRDVWAANKTARTAEKVEENVRYIKLAFPVKETQVWNGNAQNTFGSQEYSYRTIDLRRTIGNIVFDSVLEVEQLEVDNIVEKKSYAERYARNVGMVFKKVIDIESQPNPNWSLPSFPYGTDSLIAFYAKPILQRVTSGVQYTITVNSFGIE